MQRSEMRFYNAKLCARLQKMFCSTDGSQECSELHNFQMEEVQHKQDPCENYSAAHTEQLTQTSFSENADQEPDDHSEIQRCCVEGEQEPTVTTALQLFFKQEKSFCKTRVFFFLYFHKIFEYILIHIFQGYIQQNQIFVIKILLFQ